MATKTLSLADFLLARIDEDEAITRSIDADPRRVARNWGAGMRAVAMGSPWRSGRDRLFAECAAKRWIVEVHEHVYRQGDGNLVGDEWACQTCLNEWYWCPTLRALALPYSDHPDYRPEWRP